MRVALTTLVALTLVPAGSADRASAHCDTPRFTVAQVLNDSGSALLANIVVRETDIAPHTLTCLATSLRSQYPDRDLSFSIFTDRTAAKHFSIPYLTTENEGSYTAALKASYYYSIARVHKLEIGGFLPALVMVLPITGPPRCLTQIGGRCVAAMDELQYPTAERVAGTSGSVTISGIVTRGGRIVDVRAGADPTSPSGPSDAFAREALRHVKTWRVGKAASDTPLQVRYVWSADKPEPYTRTHTEMDLRTPDQISLRIMNR